MNNILIIGAGGFLGSSLYKFLQTKNFNIYGLSHSSQSDCNIFQFCLEEKIPNEILNKEYIAVIYLVHIYDKNKQNQLISWYSSTFDTFKNIAKKQIYISSYSANEFAESNYGKTKYCIEQFFINNNADVINPGLIVGNGGIYSKIYKAVEKLPIIVSPTIKSSKLPLVSVENICLYILDIIQDKYQTKKHIVYSEFITLTDLIKRILIEINKKKIIIEINAHIILLPMIILENIGIKLPVSSDSLIGFIKNQRLQNK